MLILEHKFLAGLTTVYLNLVALDIGALRTKTMGSFCFDVAWTLSYNFTEVEWGGFRI